MIAQQYKRLTDAIFKDARIAAASHPENAGSTDGDDFLPVLYGLHLNCFIHIMTGLALNTLGHGADGVP
jgi:hypothetical protein